MNRRAAECYAVLLCLAAAMMGTARGATEKRPTERVSPAPEVNPNAVIWHTPKPPAKPQAGDVWVNRKDGMQMVYIAPGQFVLGTSAAQIDAWVKEHPKAKRKWFKSEPPQCRVNLPGYWIGRTEVTNAQYLRYVRATGHRAPVYWKGGKLPSGLEDFPVVYVTWEDAREYCEWAGGHLPTELQWQKAARGINGRVFPWGNQWDRKRCRNLMTGRQYRSKDEWRSALEMWLKSHDRVREGPAAVGSYPADCSPYGCLDLAGNVMEWCADWYAADAYRRYARGDLTPPRKGKERVLRGGSWDMPDPWDFRCAYGGRIVPDACSGVAGFRCAHAGRP